MSDNTTAKNPRPAFRGMMPILPTAITAAGELDEASQRRLVQYCLKCGAAAIGHFGFASEFYKIPEGDRRRLIEIIVDEVAGRAPVFIGVTAPAVRIAVNYAKEAADLGADLIMAASPYVVVPSPDEMAAYYRTLSEAVPIPIIIQDTAVSDHILTAEMLWRLYREVENVYYIKAEGKSFLAKTAAFLALSGSAAPVIGGAGGRHMIHMLRAGITAFMTGTEALEIHAAVVNAYLAGDEPKAARIYFEQVLPYLAFYLEHPAELLKWMLHDRGVIDCPKVIAPAGAAPISELERREFEWVLDRIGWRKRWPDIP